MGNMRYYCFWKYGYKIVALNMVGFSVTRDQKNQIKALLNDFHLTGDTKFHTQTKKLEPPWTAQ